MTSPARLPDNAPHDPPEALFALGSLFSGYGGLEMAVGQFYGARTVWVSDIDPGACKILAHRMPDVPNLGDITKIDWAAVEPVDILTGGWPCQPFSLAGKQLGANDVRALWPFVAGAVRALRPRYVVLENVAAIATAGELARATADLAALGYVGSWRCLRAADVGAPHGRARIFILAADTGIVRRDRGPARQQGWRFEAVRFQARDNAGDTGGQPPTNPDRSAWRRIGAGSIAPRSSQRVVPETGRRAGRDRDSRPATDTDSDAIREQPVAESGRSSATIARQPGADAATDTTSSRRRAGIADDVPRRGEPDTAWGAYGPAIARWERRLGRPAPPPTQTSPKGSQRLSAHFVEFMMGLPEGWVCDVPGLTRNEQLKALGNGVVPQQAYEALRQLSLIGGGL